jgi:glycosyltransferase involved in cell wall biosynthesis
MPRVSVIIPNYNHAIYLQQRIESVLHQTYQDIELIMLDDCSTDNSKEIMEQYRLHSKVSHIVYNEQNSGFTFKQWQKGIELASGELIWIAESDDWANFSFLSTCIQKLSDDCSIGVCCTASVPVDHLGNRIPDTVLTTPFDQFIEEKGNIQYCRNGKEEIREKLVYKNFLPNASAVVFKKELFVGAVQLNCSYKYIADWWVWYQMLQHTNFCFIPEPLNFFRFHENTTRSSANKRVASFIERYHLLRQFCNDGYLQPNNQYYDRLFYCLYVEMVDYSVIQKLSTFTKVFPYDNKIFRRLAHSVLVQLKGL